VTVFKRLCETDLVKDNYFYYGYIAGEYSEECCPRYLKKEHYASLRKAIEGKKLFLFEGTLVECLKKRTETYTVASLLDHMDWMPPQVSSLFFLLLLQEWRCLNLFVTDDQ
jgi:S-adenosylmethionine-diacylglycerol 3-amino-3-carboxypropyl transferase